MPKIYQSPSARKNALLSLFLGAAFSFFVFLLVPVTQFIADVAKVENAYEVQQASLPPPEEFQFEEEEIKEEEAPEEEIELEQEPPKLTLDQLELALNPGMGGDLAGDFALPGFSASKGDLDLNAIYELDDLDQKPRPVKQVRPKYPRQLASRKVEGVVKLTFVIDQNGDVIDIKVVDATFPEFGEAAMAALREWKFEPGMKNAQVVKARGKLSIPFSIK
ncbi:energy transducer TonB [Ruficoccus amylovorans]|uniref:Energy transducer TonB n=1 Tax=Ruficoccus amylovorans TaxID=1804625 RepID=A0A842HF01_9BACT|nr:energy transducer TonB [Ruficoccus amylovorans]MBC2594839.1 energy transducer TonB [Ruficoccus amylovorans]